MACLYAVQHRKPWIYIQVEFKPIASVFNHFKTTDCITTVTGHNLFSLKLHLLEIGQNMDAFHTKIRFCFSVAIIR